VAGLLVLSFLILGVQQFQNFLTLGAVYALVALGYTMVYGIIELINFAHGDVFMVGAFVSMWIMTVPLGLLDRPIDDPIRLGGILLIVLGMHMIGLITIPFLMRELDLRLEGNTTGLPRSFLIGLAFGVGFTPCVGPYLALILDLLLNEDLASGAVLLLAYALGLGVPFLVIAAGIGGTRRVTRALARGIRVLNLAGGALVILMGLVLVSGQFARLPQLFNFL